MMSTSPVRRCASWVASSAMRTIRNLLLRRFAQVIVRIGFQLDDHVGLEMGSPGTVPNPEPR